MNPMPITYRGFFVALTYMICVFNVKSPAHLGIWLFSCCVLLVYEEKNQFSLVLGCSMKSAWVKVSVTYGQRKFEGSCEETGLYFLPVHIYLVPL